MVLDLLSRQPEPNKKRERGDRTGKRGKLKLKKKKSKAGLALILRPIRYFPPFRIFITRVCVCVRMCAVGQIGPRGKKNRYYL